jgi:hypothetical protein
MKKRLVGIILEAPAILLLIVAAIITLVLNLSSDFRAKFGVANMPLGVFIIFLVILGLYFWGRYLETESYSHNHY